MRNICENFRNFFYKKIIIIFAILLFYPQYIQATKPAANLDELAKLKTLYRRPKNIPFPDNNPFSKEKVLLGKFLFFDPRLSSSKVMSCATCHNPSFAWGDGLDRAVGNGHVKLKRKTPTLINIAWNEATNKFFWDGRASSLEEQSLIVILSVAEMHSNIKDLLKSVENIEGYRNLFKHAFPDNKNPISADNFTKAIATFERTIVSESAPFDKWIEGDENAISSSAKRGFLLFNQKARCATCHNSWNFTDYDIHDIGLNTGDLGAGVIYRDSLSSQFAFKTPTLRNINLRAPYMHDGSLQTLMDVIDHYDSKFTIRESLSPNIGKLDLTNQEKNELIEFLKTLTSEDSPIELPKLPM